MRKCAYKQDRNDKSILSCRGVHWKTCAKKKTRILLDYVKPVEVQHFVDVGSHGFQGFAF